MEFFIKYQNDTSSYLVECNRLSLVVTSDELPAHSCLELGKELAKRFFLDTVQNIAVKNKPILSMKEHLRLKNKVRHIQAKLSQLENYSVSGFVGGVPTDDENKEQAKINTAIDKRYRQLREAMEAVEAYEEACKNDPNFAYELEVERVTDELQELEKEYYDRAPASDERIRMELDSQLWDSIIAKKEEVEEAKKAESDFKASIKNSQKCK